MALPALISGADCGPINPLQSLSKQFDRDRGIQQDHFGPGRAGSSREVFRTQSAPAPGPGKEAAQFFSGQASSSTFSPHHVVPSTFDLHTLRGSLPRQDASVQLPASAWAGDFLNQPIVHAKSHTSSKIDSSMSLDANHVEVPYMSYTLPMQNSFIPGGFRRPMQPLPVFRETIPHELLGPHPETKAPAVTQADFPPEEVKPLIEPIDADELSRTAGLLIDTVKEETNPKFKNSAFLGLMRQLRDKEMVVDGTDMVKVHASASESISSVWAQDFTIDVKGKGKARDENGWADAFQETVGAPLATSKIPVTQEERGLRRSYLDQVARASQEHLDHRPSLSIPGVTTRRKSVHFEHPEVLENGSTSADQVDEEVEDAEDTFWKQENNEYRNYWTAAHRQENLRPHSPVPEWDRLQADWDRFEATATGIRPVTVYQFQPNNPYVVGDSSTRNHAMHTQSVRSNESILEKEAAVQNDIRNPLLWFELGVKQQENERELSAIQALQRAVELNPSYLEAWLALSISYTNEGDRSGAYHAIEQWLRNNERFGSRRPMALLDQGEEKMAGERHEELVQCLMALARVAPDGEIDADTQIALGVVLNTSEDYEKAQDCFRAALAVRPNDCVLYNRVGATLANSGRADDALWYYYRALELNPSYIRARFNLGISCINMKRYEEAAEHILDALVLQENDASHGADGRGITSSVLWECLRTTCIQLQRPQLTSLCDSRDLEGFRNAFWTE